ncbi:MAG: EAL domain-containing protein [Gammaproteobacteria bacterium]
MNCVFNPGEVVFLEGEPGNCAYIIVRGCIRLTILVEGKQQVISELREGDVFGEMALIDNHLRSATAVAVVKSELIVVPSKYFEEKLGRADNFVALLLKVLLRNYREMRARLDNVLSQSGCRTPLIVDGVKQGLGNGALKTARHVEAVSDLKEAFSLGQLELFYQPIIELCHGRVVGCESLIRWRHPERGLISPAEFVGLAEESGLIVQIGLWIIEEASQASLRFGMQIDGFDFVSINLSGKQFAMCNLADEVRQIFAENSIQPEKIKFEITESILMENPLDTADSLNALKEIGSDIAIDDFGTGYSSFSYLHRFPIDTLKIDKSFVSTMKENVKSYEIVKSLCVLAKSIGMNIVAEGVETLEEHKLLTEMGVDYGQGYYYAKPMPEAEFNAFLLKLEIGRRNDQSTDICHA